MLRLDFNLLLLVGYRDQLDFRVVGLHALREALLPLERIPVSFVK
jgi:hypothetical protein